MDKQDTTAATTTAEKISLLDDFHAALKACGRLGADALEVIEEELGIHKAGLTTPPADDADTGADAGDMQATGDAPQDDAAPAAEAEAAAQTGDQAPQAEQAEQTGDQPQAEAAAEADPAPVDPAPAEQPADPAAA